MKWWPMAAYTLRKVGDYRCSIVGVEEMLLINNKIEPLFKRIIEKFDPFVTSDAAHT